MATYQVPSSARRATEHRETMIGPYRRLESIGKGSFATVYKGIHPANGALVAIKTVQHASLKGKLKINLFSEIDILKHIQHPHIVALIGILESTNHIHLVMEFCQLGDLATFVKKRDKLAVHPVTAEMIRHYPNPPGAGFNEVIVRHFAKQLAAALEFLRSKNYVHRDLKPQNLLLNPPAAWIASEPLENRPFEVTKNSLIPMTGLSSLPSLKIADFGFARHLPTTTMAETLCGSPLYMAPEILRYEKYDAKADLWSVGTVLYELMVGKPPFRAANHVDLLRKIEKAMDKIKFPDESSISDNMQDVIRSLLKKMPTERISWEGFFQSAIITEDIPGLVAADKPQKVRPDDVQQQRESTVNTESLSSERRPGDSDRDRELMEPEFRPPHERPLTGAHPDTPPSRRAVNEEGRLQRPSLVSHATTPVQGPTRDSTNTTVGMERRRSLNPSNQATGVGGGDSDRLGQRVQDKTVREAREKAAHDIAFERDYVMVEKRAVEVNAFADELAASPQIHGVNRDSSALVRRATTHSSSPSAAGGPSTSPRSMQMAVRPESLHQRKASYDRRYGPSKSSASSALAAALDMVNFRLHGGLFSPSSGKGPSPPQTYGAFPTFPTISTSPLSLGDVTKPATLDEDQQVLATVEECATRSDVVYGFAEVKYKQLIPVTPSNDNILGMRKFGRSSSSDLANTEQDDLTVTAVVAISEEALVLYVKALAILTNTINLAGNWWSHKNRGEVLGEVPRSPRSVESSKAGFAATGMRINNVVQWARSRFNECLEKSEYVSRRLVDSQQRLPSSHAGHPQNHPSKPTGQNKGSSGTEINLSSGVTAEKLMYDRALEMSRSAAVNELVGEDLPGCEMSYVTAMRLLEAVLENDDDTSFGKDGLTRKRNDKRNIKDGDVINGIEESDRRAVLKLIDSMNNRVSILRKKINMQQAARRNSFKGANTLIESPGNTSIVATARTPPK